MTVNNDSRYCLSSISDCQSIGQPDPTKRIDEIKTMIHHRLYDFTREGVQHPVLQQFMVNADAILLSADSKRLRCILPVLIADHCRLSEKECLDYGIIVELLHYTSLIHDDVIDEDQYRRHCKTLNNAFPNSQAVLMGDYIVCLAIEFCLTFTHNKQVVALVVKAMKDLITGIMIEQRLLPEEPSLDHYHEMAIHKTGSLFGLSFGLPFIGTNRYEDALKCGELFGVLFQVFDDYLDRQDDHPTHNIFGIFPQREVISFWDQQLERFLEYSHKLELQPMVACLFHHLSTLGYFQEIQTRDGLLFRNPLCNTPLS